MKKTYDQAEDVLRFYLDQPEGALVVLTFVSGGTIRAKGSMMVVTPAAHAGYISNGCVDADIIARARSGQSGLFIYGDGSPFRDIALPCGGRLDVSIHQNLDKRDIEITLSSLANRKETALNLGDLRVPVLPRIKLRIAGRGAVCVALAELAEATGFDVHVQSPEPDILPESEHLINPNDPPGLSDDERTAVVCLFHDHDWEAALLKQALAGPAFYVGAMGSELTHKARSEKLAQVGVSAQKIKGIKAPIGLVPAQRDSRFLAISILAEIIETAQSKRLI